MKVFSKEKEELPVYWEDIPLNDEPEPNKPLIDEESGIASFLVAIGFLIPIFWVVCWKNYKDSVFKQARKSAVFAFWSFCILAPLQLLILFLLSKQIFFHPK